MKHDSSEKPRCDHNANKPHPLESGEWCSGPRIDGETWDETAKRVFKEKRRHERRPERYSAMSITAHEDTDVPAPQPEKPRCSHPEIHAVPDYFTGSKRPCGCAVAAPQPDQRDIDEHFGWNDNVTDPETVPHPETLTNEMIGDEYSRRWPAGTHEHDKRDGFDEGAKWARDFRSSPQQCTNPLRSEITCDMLVRDNDSLRAEIASLRSSPQHDAPKCLLNLEICEHAEVCQECRAGKIVVRPSHPVTAESGSTDLRRLIAKWRDKADRPSTNTLSDGVVVGLRECADELEAALSSASTERDAR